MTQENIIVAVLVAGGRGMRANTPGPKQWEPLLDRRVADWTVSAFSNHPDIHHIVVVHHADDLRDAQTLQGVSALCPGGATRAQSVSNGLARAAEFRPTHVMIHDMARPCISPDILARCAAALAQSDAVAPALPVADALWRGTDGRVTGAVDRSGLYRAQTPQCFAYDRIVAAHRSAPASSADDVEVALAAGIDVTIVDGDEDNLKITYPADFDRAARILETR